MFTISNTNKGVKAFIGGLKAEDISAKIEACKEGNCSCSCDPQMMQKISNIEVKSEENGASITIEGDVNAQELEPMMKGCLL